MSVQPVDRGFQQDLKEEVLYGKYSPLSGLYSNLAACAVRYSVEKRIKHQLVEIKEFIRRFYHIDRYSKCEKLADKDIKMVFYTSLLHSLQIAAKAALLGVRSKERKGKRIRDDSKQEFYEIQIQERDHPDELDKKIIALLEMWENDPVELIQEELESADMVYIRNTLLPCVRTFNDFPKKPKTEDLSSLKGISSSSEETPPFRAESFKITSGNGVESPTRPIQSRSLRPGCSIKPPGPDPDYFSPPSDSPKGFFVCPPLPCPVRSPKAANHDSQASSSFTSSS